MTAVKAYADDRRYTAQLRERLGETAPAGIIALGI
jgi:hypothetical protein